IGNGGVNPPEDADDMIRVSGVDGVMIGRGAVGNPWLFEQISNHWKQMEPVSENFPTLGENQQAATQLLPTIGNRRDVIEKHLTRLVELTSVTVQGRRCKARYDVERGACLHFRPHLAQYIKGLRGRRDLLQHLNEMDDVKTIMSAVDRVLSQNVDATSSSRPNTTKRDEDVASTGRA
ncbi:MAG: tRNA-dihydrouridine synthase, partial [Kiritimatiellales bacterium]